jgi:hypothetical protein
MNAVIITSGAVLCSIASSVVLETSCHKRCDARANPNEQIYENCLKECLFSHKPPSKIPPPEHDRLFRKEFDNKRELIRDLMKKENN